MHFFMTKLASTFALAIATALLTLTLVYAGELGGVTMPETLGVEGKALKLNGMGLREATIFHVKVYAGGLYLETLTHNSDEILKSPQLKRVQMQFLRDVDSLKIRETWQENMERNCGSKCESLKSQIAKLLTFFDKDVKKGDTMTFTFLPGKTEVHVGPELKGSIEGTDFATVALMSWIGPNPPNSSLKEGLLGLNQKK